MNLYLKICASMYRFYVRHNDSLPDAMVFWLTSTLLTFNFWAIYDFFSYFIFTNLPFSEELLFISVGIIALFNYLIFFRSKEYKEIVPPKNFGYKVIAYLVISALFTATTAKLHHDRNVKLKEQSQIESGE